MALERCRLTVLFVIPTAVALSQCMGVGGCGCPISCRMSLMILTSCALRNRAPSSASAAEAATSLRTEHRLRIAPLRKIGWLS